MIAALWLRGFTSIFRARTRRHAADRPDFEHPPGLKGIFTRLMLTGCRCGCCSCTGTGEPGGRCNERQTAGCHRRGGDGGLTALPCWRRLVHRLPSLRRASYPGGCAGTYYYRGYSQLGRRWPGVQPGGPHAIVGEKLGIDWPKPADPPGVPCPTAIVLGRDRSDVLAQFPASAPFWASQARAAEMAWKMAARALPWPPAGVADVLRLAQIGLEQFPDDVRLARLAFSTTRQWLDRHGLAGDPAFTRFIDGLLLISAQTTSTGPTFHSATASICRARA